MLKSVGKKLQIVVCQQKSLICFQSTLQRGHGGGKNLVFCQWLNNFASNCKFSNKQKDDAVVNEPSEPRLNAFGELSEQDVPRSNMQQ